MEKHRDIYTIKQYLSFVERFVLSFYTKHLLVTNEVKIELKKLYIFCKKLFSNNYELLDQKMSIVIGIDSILYSKNKKGEIELLQEVLRLAKPNINLIEGKN